MNEHREAQITATKILNENVRLGTLLRPSTCDLCRSSGENGIVGHHWRGYDYPLDVWWICSRCNQLLRGKHDGSMTKEQARDFVVGGRFALLKGIPISIQDEIALSEDARALSHSAKSANTRRAYRFGWSDFEDWCRRFRRNPLPATVSTVAEYLRILSEVNKVSTLQVKLAAISFAHVAAHQPDPTGTPEVQAVMAGIRHERGSAPNKKAPVTRDDLERMIAKLPTTLAGRRDKAILLLGFAGAFRRSELIALEVKHIVFLDDRAVITLPRSKTDQEGKGTKKHVPRAGGTLDPVSALQAWLSSAAIHSGPIFRKVDRWGKIGAHRMNSGAIAKIVKAAARAAGLNPDVVASHSLRSGFITSAAGRNVAEWKIQQVSQHKSVEVLRGYIQDAGQGGLEAIREVLGD